MPEIAVSLIDCRSGRQPRHGKAFDAIDVVSAIRADAARP
jgi:hypothetical protein